MKKIARYLAIVVVTIALGLGLFVELKYVFQLDTWAIFAAISGLMAVSILVAGSFRSYLKYIDGNNATRRAKEIADQAEDLRTLVSQQVQEITDSQTISGDKPKMSQEDRLRVRIALSKIRTISKITDDRFLDNINDEIDELKRTANINLLLGTFMFTICISILAFFMIAPLFMTYSKLAFTGSTTFLVSKLTFTASFAGFALFFLTAYRNSVNQVRYYRNEISNIKMWNKAFYQDILNNDGRSSDFVLKKMLATERNFILKKGETTVELLLHDAENAATQGAVRELLTMRPKQGAKPRAKSSAA